MNQANARTPVSGYIFMGLAWLLVACIVAQTFLAGLSIFTDATHWKDHEMFVHIFEFVPILMLIFAFAGRLPQSMKWMSFGIFALIYFQYFTAHMPGAGALHPVVALILFWASLHLAKRISRWCLKSGTPQ